MKRYLKIIALCEARAALVNLYRVTDDHAHRGMFEVICDEILRTWTVLPIPAEERAEVDCQREIFDAIHRYCLISLADSLN